MYYNFAGYTKACELRLQWKLALLTMYGQSKK